MVAGVPQSEVSDFGVREGQLACPKYSSARQN